MAPPSAHSGNRPPQHLPIGILSGVIGCPVEIGTGDVLDGAVQVLWVGVIGAGRADGGWGTHLSLVTI